jgi:dTDP-glucose pyrophosphorylase
MALIDENQCGIALVVDVERRLLGTVTDGDLRRAVLAQVNLESPVAGLLADHGLPVTAEVSTGSDELLRLMEARGLRHVPLLDADGRVADLAFLDELVKDSRTPLRAVVMAGGLGLRLGELTAETPKPMLPIADTPLLELTVARLRDAGISQVAFTTHYRADAIREHFGDGRAFGVDVHYLDEEEPLGTAGGLSLLEDGNEPVLVMNGDVLTRFDIRSFVAFHVEHTAVATVAVLPYELRIPYGVVELEGAEVTALAEKPVLRRYVNAGIYLLSPEARRSLERGRHCDMPDLIERLLARGAPVVAFPLREYWLDIGDAAMYEQANRDARAGL